tara:strand:+ start:340 stop:816 length:477 start_codon:yes stop_codon:yes gene_type:complete
MWKNDLVSAIQSNRVLETSIEPELINQNWTTIVNMIDSHPKDLIKVESQKNRTELQELHRRARVKPIVKEIISLLQNTCPDKQITNIAFIGFGKHKSFPLHKDSMDVLLLQVKGRIRLKVKKINKVMVPGDVVYIPRGTDHEILPLQSRVTYSFGIEG